MLIEIDGFTVRHRINRRIKHAYLQVEHDGTLLLKSNGRDMEALRRFILSRRAWILQQQARAAQHPSMQIGRSILYLGESVSPESAGIGLDGASGEPALRKRYDLFYRQSADRHLMERTQHFARLMEVDYKQIRFRKMKRRWGSCSKEGIITYNTLLMQLPEAMIDYTVVHELAHRVHFNHSAAFHKLVSLYIPEEKAIRSEMRHRKAVSY